MMEKQVAKNKKPYTIHATDIVLNREELKHILDRKGISYTDLQEKLVEKYGLDISYKGFMSLLENRSAWKLIYAWAIADVLSVEIKEIFEIVDIDVEAKIKEKKEWKKKYQKKK